MLFYIITVLLGIALDFKWGAKGIKKTYRKLFVVWLFVFLCFGYMTGSDWRNYEIEFTYMNSIKDLGWINEMGFNFIFLFLKKVFGDFWIVVGILKCLFLYTFLRVVKKITPFWLSVTSLMVTDNLSFVLIDNPLRFMTALILVNIAIEFCLSKRNGFALLFIILSFFLHNTSIFFVLLIPCIVYAERIVKLNKILLVLLYGAVLVLSSNAELIELLRQSMISLAVDINEDVSSYYAYAVTSNASFFTLGNLVSIVMFVIILLTKDEIIKSTDNGKLIYGMTILNAFLTKLLLLIPTGFRLAIPFGIFYMAYMIYLIRSKSILKWFFIAYISLSFPMNIWNTYKYIPYSNSIPYIIKGHKDYTERSMYNINAYEERTGKMYNGVY